MNELNYFKNCFSAVNPALPIEVTGIQKNEFSFDITVSNAIKTYATEKTLYHYFGGIHCSVNQIEGTHSVKVSVSRVEVPKFQYSALDIIRHIENNCKNGFLLGIGNFGPTYLNSSEITHAGVFGATGYGKSSFFKMLISQSLAFNDHVINHIIDPKRIDFSAYKDHPRVGIVANSREEVKSLITALLVEMSVREHYFSEGFSTPPTSLEEYQNFRKTHKRSDLPDFPKVFVWVDEAHQFFNFGIFDADSYMEKWSSYLAKKGRAFGIHFLFSTQRPADIDPNIRTQFSHVFTFFNSETLNHPTFDGVEIGDKNVAIKGRLTVINREAKQSEAIQVPFLDSKDALGFAFSYSKDTKFKNKGFFKLSIDQNLLNDGCIATYISRGYSISNVTEKAYDYKSSSASYKFQFSFPELYLNVGSDERVILALDDDSDEESDTSEPRSSRSKKEEIARPKNPVQFSHISKTDNSSDIEKTISEFHKKREASTNRFEQFIRDLTSNEALINIYKSFYGYQDPSSHGVNKDSLKLSDLALTSPNQTIIEKYCQAVKTAIESNKKSPLLIINGKDGLGKDTILKVISNSLGYKIRNATPADLNQEKGRVNSSSDFLHEDIKKETKDEVSYSKEEPIFVVFTSPMVAIDYYRHCKPGILPVLVHTVTEPSSFFGMQIPASAPNFSYLNDYHYLISLEEASFAKSEILNKLIQTLLTQYQFKDESAPSDFGSHFAKAGVKLTPKHMNSIIERASKKALFKGVSLNWSIIQEILEDFKINNKMSCENVEMITPQKTMDDLIVNEKVKDNVIDVIHRAKNLDNVRFQFVKKLRKNSRIVALFSGPAGTGKSLAGEVIAKETGKDLWVMDFSKVQGKFVGETEKFLSETFNSAQAAKAVLLVDECDAFLGSRESVDSEYTRKIVNHLLNLIENYSGILILTTNYSKHLDTAFSRRIDMKVEFSNPGMDEMKKIVKLLLEPDAPLEPGFDYDQVLDGITLSGGLIRNAIERSVIKMERENSNILTMKMVNSALWETQKENSVIEEKRRMIRAVS